MRFIPAGAGNTTIPSFGYRNDPVYPRWRGEHLRLLTVDSLMPGLSPLARGTLFLHSPLTDQCRFIPAGAGNTGGLSLVQIAEPVYPRWRGEHQFVKLFPDRETGLSPLARGTLMTRSRRVTFLRFIPAGAGNTISKDFRVSTESVYPRWRGEHVFHQFRGCLPAGLSPLARGTRSDSLYSLHHCRFIPAGAGNTYLFIRPLSHPSVYPRWRGEHRRPAVPSQSTDGLSPLARGTQSPNLADSVMIGFIPAGAGNTITAYFSLKCYPVYPRWRGEHVVINGG